MVYNTDKSEYIHSNVNNSHQANPNSPYSSLYGNNELTPEVNYLPTNSTVSGKFDNSNQHAMNYPSLNIFTQGSGSDIKDMYIEKVKSNTDLLPEQYRKKVSKINIGFTTATIFYANYFLYKVFQDYPNISQKSKQNILISTTVFIGLCYFYSKYNEDVYNKAFNSLSLKYRPEQIKELIENYTEFNKNQYKHQLPSDNIENHRI